MFVKTSNAAQHAAEIHDADKAAFSDGVAEVLCTMAHLACRAAMN